MIYGIYSDNWNIDYDIWYIHVHVLYLLEDEGSSDQGIVYDEKAIEALLDRSQVGEDDKRDENLLANEYLGQFKVRVHVHVQV